MKRNDFLNGLCIDFEEVESGNGALFPPKPLLKGVKWRTNEIGKDGKIFQVVIYGLSDDDLWSVEGELEEFVNVLEVSETFVCMEGGVC